MRKFLVAAIVVLSCSSADAQQPFGGGRPGGGPGGPGGSFDPSMIFDKYANGRPYILISDLNKLRGPLSTFAKDNGINDDKITRAQFTTFWAQKDKYFGNPGGGPGGGRSPFGGGPPGAMAMPTAPGGAPMNPIDMMNQWAESDFRRRDQNGDGFLNADEMPSSLREQIDRWDTNRDGLISLDEYRPYFAAKMQSRDGSDAPPSPITIIIEDDLDKRPTVYRAGKLPKDLPKWFAELDTDNDGQVAMHEWRKGGKDLDEFREWDRNDDGFITVEEVLAKNRSSGTAVASAKGPSSVSATTDGGGGRPSFTRGPGGGGDRPSMDRPRGERPNGMGGFGKKKKNQDSGN